MRQLAQYCETGGAVDSMLEVFIVNCLFLYRSKVRVQMTKHLLYICESDISFQLRLEELIELNSVGFGAVGNVFLRWHTVHLRLKNKECGDGCW